VIPSHLPYLHTKLRRRKEGNDDPRSHLPIAAYDAFLSELRYRKGGKGDPKKSRTKKIVLLLFSLAVGEGESAWFLLIADYQCRRELLTIPTSQSCLALIFRSNTVQHVADFCLPDLQTVTKLKAPVKAHVLATRGPRKHAPTAVAGQQQTVAQ
jgi:hypothetical protein